MVDIYGMMADTQRSAQDGYKRGQQSRLAGLAQQSMQAPRDQRQGLIAQMAGVSPAAAYDAESHFKGMDDNARARLGEYATAFDALPDEQKARAYPQLAKQAQELGIPAPGQWNPSFAPNIQKLAQALRGGVGGTPASLQEFQYMAQGLGADDLAKARRVALGLDGRASNAGFQTIEVENEQGGKDRYTFDPRRNVYTRFAEGAPQVPAQGQPASGEVPFSIDPNLPPAVQAAIRSDRQKFDSVPNGGTIRVPGVVPAGPRPGVGMSAADKAYAAEQAQQRAQLDTLSTRGDIEAENAAKKAAAEAAAKAQSERDSTVATKAVDAQRALSLLDEAERLLPLSTGSGIGNLVDAGAAMFGKSTPGAQAITALQTIAGQLTSAMPRMQGPQSDKDVQLYRQMAGDLANPTLPVESRMAALKQIRRLNQKYAGGGDAPKSTQIGNGGWSIQRVP